MLRVPRLTFVVGKGGVGKTTVAGALAQALAGSGRRVLLVGVGVAPAATGDEVTRLTVDGEAAFAEYLGTVLPVTVAQRIAQSRLVRRFVVGAPGLRELMAIGKIADEERQASSSGPRWDAIVVDAPATGHAIELLRMPAAIAEAFGGRVRWEGERILAQLRDGERTAVWLVSTAEEMPVRESLEAADELRGRLGLRLGALVVNRLEEAPSVPWEAIQGGEGLAGEVLGCAREQVRWATRQRQHLLALRAALALPCAVLPRLAAEPQSPAALAELGASLMRQLGGLA